MGQALAELARLLPVTMSWMELAAKLVGRLDVAQRLCGF